MRNAKFVKEIVVIDPDSKGEVSLSVFKHENGGMFALDSSYIVQVLPEEGDCTIPDPFNEFDDLEEGIIHKVNLTGV